jgi:signal transduction histidine kinase
VEGSGLGLAIAGWIAELHKAQFEVVSMEKTGTTFHIYFRPDAPAGAVRKEPGHRENSH